MPILYQQILTSKSIEYAIDLPIDFTTQSSLLRLFKGLLSQRHLTSKAIAIQNDKSLRFTSYSLKTNLRFLGSNVPVKFQIYDKQADLARLISHKDLVIPPITRFELTILFSFSAFSEQTFNDYKKLYYSFLKPITLEELILFEENISFQLYKNFCQEKVEIPKLQITDFIVKNSEHFMTKDILYNFYKLLFHNKLSKTLPKVSFYKFKKSKHVAIIGFSSLTEVNNLIGSLRAQLS